MGKLFRCPIYEFYSGVKNIFNIFNIFIIIIIIMKGFIRKLLREGLEGVNDSMFTPEEKSQIMASANKQYNYLLKVGKERFEKLKVGLGQADTVLNNIMKTTNFSPEEKDSLLKQFQKMKLEKEREYEVASSYYKRLIDEKDEIINEIYKRELVSADGLGYRITREKQRAENMNKKLDSNDLINLFVNALEGGSNYWYYIKHIPREVEYAINHMGESSSEAIGKYLLGGGKIYFYDVEEVGDGDDSDALSVEDDDKGYLGYVDMDKILDGITLLKRDYVDSYENILDGQDDANDADIFLQLCVMGDVVYG